MDLPIRARVNGRAQILRAPTGFAQLLRSEDRGFLRKSQHSLHGMFRAQCPCVEWRAAWMEQFAAGAKVSRNQIYWRKRV